MESEVQYLPAVHLTIRLGEALSGSHSKLAKALMEHRRHSAAICEFIKATLDGDQTQLSELEIIDHVRQQESWSDVLDWLEPSLDPYVRAALHRYYDEVTKLARVVRLETSGLDTDTDSLNASVNAVLWALHTRADAQRTVANCHSDTAV